MTVFLAYCAQRRRRFPHVDVSCAFLMHRDLEHVGNRIHYIRMRAVREDVLDPLVQVFVTDGIVVSCCELTKD